MRLRAVRLRMRPRKIGFALSFLAMLASLSSPLSLRAANPLPTVQHPDPPGNPILFVVRGHDVKLTEDEDDGFDGNCELLLVILVDHDTHAKSHRVSYSRDDFNCDDGLTWSPFIAAPYGHEECTPRNSAKVQTALTELDCGSKETAIAVLTSAARAALACYLGPIACGVAIVGGVVTILIVALNGHDDLGATAGPIPDAVKVFASRGKDGGADIKLEGVTTPSADNGQCNGRKVAFDDTPPAALADSVYAPLSSALVSMTSIDVEDGNPADLNPQEVADIRGSLESLVLGIAETAAGSVIEDAASDAGVSLAIAHFALAKQREGMGDASGAVDAYRDAFLAAAMARVDSMPGPTTRLPRQIALAPDFFATTRFRTVATVATVLGATGSALLDVGDPPPGMNVQVIQDDLTIPVFRLHIETGSVSPGTYVLPLTASDATGEASRSLTLVISPAEPPVAVTVEDFLATPSDQGILLSWRLSEEAALEVRDVRVQRADTAPGPFIERTLQPLAPSQTNFEDLGVEAGRPYWYRLVLTDLEGGVTESAAIAVTGGVNGRLALEANFDPLADAVVVRYRLPAAAPDVAIEIFDVAGHRRQILQQGKKSGGQHEVVWDARDTSGARVARGVYLVQLRSGSANVASKVVIVRD